MNIRIQHAGHDDVLNAVFGAEPLDEDERSRSRFDSRDTTVRTHPNSTLQIIPTNKHVGTKTHVKS